jgi:DNA polymerase III epsilon subunit-like protein
MKHNLIVIDLETSGDNPVEHQILSIGAVDFTTRETFYGECKLNAWDKYMPEALAINGFTVEQIYDPTKPTPLKLYSDFLNWAVPRNGLLAGQNVGSFDVQFLMKNNRDYGQPWPFRYNYVDLHSVFYAKYGQSLSLKKICQFFGVKPKPTIHNALTGAQKVAECLDILLKSQI